MQEDYYLQIYQSQIEKDGLERSCTFQTLIQQNLWHIRQKPFHYPVISGSQINQGEFYQFNLSSCIRQHNSLTAQFVSFSLANLANIFYPPDFYNN